MSVNISSSSSSSSGIGFLGLLTIVFIVLKITGYIDWSWWLVLLPAYGGFALFLIFGTIIGIGYLILRTITSKRLRSLRRKL